VRRGLRPAGPALKLRIRGLGAALNLLLAVVVTAAVLYLGTFWAGPLTGAGPLLNPATGFWTAGSNAASPHSQNLRLSGLQEGASVTFDASGVLHIQARTDHDLFLALGYVHARYRMFELDLIPAAGRGAFGRGPGQEPAFGGRVRARPRAQPDGGGGFEAPQRPGSRGAGRVRNWSERPHPRGQSGGDLPAFFKLLGSEPCDWMPIATAVIKGVQAQNLAYQTNPLVYARLVKAGGGERAARWFPVLPPARSETAYDPGVLSGILGAPGFRALALLLGALLCLCGAWLGSALRRLLTPAG